eukprot:gb/GFBE01031802.1/.p1 GENE.gb/GFBE01031802.1/~~gb/GFBE01031802.1/.p1  ORF type:complete len:228 (+),score=36.19 gb/GFBE01031802.1/:1-684(+)
MAGWLAPARRWWSRVSGAQNDRTRLVESQRWPTMYEEQQQQQQPGVQPQSAAPPETRHAEEEEESLPTIALGTARLQQSQQSVGGHKQPAHSRHHRHMEQQSPQSSPAAAPPQQWPKFPAQWPEPQTRPSSGVQTEAQRLIVDAVMVCSQLPADSRRFENDCESAMGFLRKSLRACPKQERAEALSRIPFHKVEAALEFLQLLANRRPFYRAQAAEVAMLLKSSIWP